MGSKKIGSMYNGRIEVNEILGMKGYQFAAKDMGSLPLAVDCAVKQARGHKFNMKNIYK